MKKQESQVVRELGKFVQAFWLELPIAAASRLLGKGDETTFRQAGWKAYDAFVGLANETTNLMYANPAVGALTGQTMERALQIQHMGSAAASARCTSICGEATRAAASIVGEASTPTTSWPCRWPTGRSSAAGCAPPPTRGSRPAPSPRVTATASTPTRSF